MALDPDVFAQLLETIDRFVEKELRPLEAFVGENDRVPEEIVAKMRDLGLFGLAIPEAYGGLGLTVTEEVQVNFRLGRTSPAFRSIIGTNNIAPVAMASALRPVSRYVSTNIEAADL